MKNIIFILLFFPLYCTSQIATVEDGNFKLHKPLGKNIRVEYPLITTNNTKTDSIINKSIKTVLYIYDSTLIDKPVSRILDSMINDGYTDITNDINYNKNGILSLSINFEYYGAYISNQSYYLNFDLITGAIISLKDIFTSEYLEILKKTIVIDRMLQREKYKEELNKDLKKRRLTQEEYDWVIKEIDNCPDIVEQLNFIITKDYVEIEAPCDFPHAIQAYAPLFELKYNWQKIKEGLNDTYKKKLLK